MRRLVCLSSLAIGVLVACGGDRAEPRFGKPADPARLLALLLEVGERPPHEIGAALAAGVRVPCGDACACLAAVAPGAPPAAGAPATPSCPAANDTVPAMWPPMELAGRYLADQVAHAKPRDRDQLLVAMAAIAVPVPRVDRARWAVPAAVNHRLLSATTTLIGIGIGEDDHWVAPMPVARFDERGARIEEAPGGATGKTAADLRTVAEALATLQGKAPAAPAVDDPPPPEADDVDAGAAADDDAQRARQQAIDQARRAGVLGQLAQGGAFADLTGPGDLDPGLPTDDDVYGGLLGDEPGAMNGGFGFGRSGYGPGGGGTGWGTIGTGRYAPLRIAFGGKVGAAPDATAPTIAVDGATTARRLAEILAAHGGVLAVADGPRTAELPVVFGDAPDHRARAAIQLIERDDRLMAVGTDGPIGSWDRRGGRYDQTVIKAALATAMSSPRPHVEISFDGGTAAELVALIDLAVSTGAGTLGVNVEAEPGYRGVPGGIGRLGTGLGTGPQVSLGQPNAVGDLDKAIIRRYIKRQLPKITYCYEKQLLTKPALEGTVRTQFFISPTGDVSTAAASGVDPEVSACVAAVIKAITFPRPRGGGGVQVNYPFNFRKV